MYIAHLIYALFNKNNFIKKCIIISFVYWPELVTEQMAGQNIIYTPGSIRMNASPFEGREGEAGKNQPDIT